MLIILGWSLRNRPKCRDLGEISAFGTGSRLEINIFAHVLLFKLDIDNTNNINNIDINDINNVNNIGLEPQKHRENQHKQHTCISTYISICYPPCVSSRRSGAVVSVMGSYPRGPRFKYSECNRSIVY